MLLFDLLGRQEGMCGGEKAGRKGGREGGGGGEGGRKGGRKRKMSIESRGRKVVSKVPVLICQKRKMRPR